MCAIAWAQNSGRSMICVPLRCAWIRRAPGVNSVCSRSKSGDPAVLTRGVNLIQLLRDGEGWRVLSILWQNEDAEDRIPAEYLTTP